MRDQIFVLKKIEEDNNNFNEERNIHSDARNAGVPFLTVSA